MAKAQVYGKRRIGVKRKGSWSLWFKRNWVLGVLACVAVAGAVLSVLLLFEPCEKKTTYETHYVKTLESVTTYETRAVVRNVSRVVNVTTTRDVVVYETVAVPVEVNVTRNVSVVKNVTTESTVEEEVTAKAPVDAVVALDSSASVDDANWLKANAAARVLLASLRSDLDDVASAFAVWANDGAIRQELAPLASAAAAEALPDAARLPSPPESPSSSGGCIVAFKGTARRCPRRRRPRRSAGRSSTTPGTARSGARRASSRPFRAGVSSSRAS